MSANMMYTAISGLNTFSEALSVVSDNIANANTTGFKSNTVDFGDLVSGLIPTENVNIVAQGVGSTVLGVTADTATGSEIQTGTWSDLMIQGSGYFAVQDATGSTYYTRDGSFQISTSGATSGYLVDSHGDEVLDSAGKPINMEQNTQTGALYSNYSIDKYGNISGTDSTGTVTTVGTIGVTTFSNPNGLIRDGENMYTPGASAGTPVTQTGDAGQAGSIVSGALEDSNVDLTQQMVNLITYQADYQANAKSIDTGNTLLQTVVNLIR